MTDPTPSTPVTIRDQMQMIAGELRGNNSDTLSSLNANLVALNENITGLRGQITLLQEAVGATPYQLLTLTTVRGLLNAMLGRLTTIALGTAPETGGDYVTQGYTIYDGRRYALFETPISGATISADGREITRDSWLGWQYYIQTTDPAPWANGVPTVPNNWAPMSLFSTFDFSVEVQYPITVYLRLVAYTYTTVVSGDWWYVADFSPIPTISGNLAVANINTLGWRVRHLTGTMKLRIKPINSDTPYLFINPGDDKILPDIAPPWQIAGRTSYGDGSGPTTFELYPPS